MQVGKQFPTFGAAPARQILHALNHFQKAKKQLVAQVPFDPNKETVHNPKFIIIASLYAVHGKLLSFFILKNWFTAFCLA
jgi:hypothetical protein